MGTETALNATGVPFDFELPLSPGRKAAALSRPVALSDEDLAVLAATQTAVESIEGVVATEATLGDMLTELTALRVNSDSTATVNVAPDTSVIKNGAASLTPKFAKISLSASGDPVAAVTGKKIRVLAYNLMGAAAVNVKFQSNAATDLTGLKYIAAAGGGLCAAFNPAGWFETVSGEKLTLSLSASVGVGGELVYIEV